MGGLSRNRRAIVAALALGAGVTWNISNVGAVADPLADAYGVSLPAVGLFTTALFVTHLLVQIPGGRAADRVGARNVGFLAVAAVVAGNAVLLSMADPALAVAARAVVGLGSGAGFVAGAEYMRSAHASPLLQGVYGAATMAGGGLAIAVVPQLEPLLGWRAPYWSALAAAVVTAAALLAARAQVAQSHEGGAGAAGLERGGRRREAQVAQSHKGGLGADRKLVRLGVLHGATFGLSVVAANWVVPLLERHGHPRGTAAVLGSLLLLGGIVSRPLGGFLATRPVAVAGALVAGAGAFAVLASPAPLPALGLAAAAAGLAAGLPFAAVFAGAQRARPDAPGAAVGFVNSWAIAAIVGGTPLLGLTFHLPGDGRIGFACVALLWAGALAAVPRSR